MARRSYSLRELDLSVSDSIRSRRTQMGLSQYQLADRIGVPRSTVNTWERGITRIWAGDVVALAQALETTPSELLGWSSEESPRRALCSEHHPRYRSLRCQREEGHSHEHETGNMTWSD